MYFWHKSICTAKNRNWHAFPNFGILSQILAYFLKLLLLKNFQPKEYCMTLLGAIQIIRDPPPPYEILC